MATLMIIGGGFAGLGALGVLRRVRARHRIVLVDRREHSDFLPLLPDVAAGRVAARHVRASLPDLCRRAGAEFIAADVRHIDAASRSVETDSGTLSSDALLICCGSETNFYGRDDLRDTALVLDSAADAERIRSQLVEAPPPAVAVAGGGYTGIEIATGLAWAFRRHGASTRVLLVEIGPSILAAMPEWIRLYAEENVRRMHVEVVTNCQISHADAAGVTLSNGRHLERARLVWAAGVCVPPAFAALPVEKTKQGRLRAGPGLELGNRVFVAGDCTAFRHGAADLRMSVQFALTQGRAAAGNMLRQLAGMPLNPYRPLDLGFVVPMANRRSCGLAAGVPVRGWGATLLHYFMSSFRAQTLSNQLGVARDGLRALLT